MELEHFIDSNSQPAKFPKPWIGRNGEHGNLRSRKLDDDISEMLEFDIQLLFIMKTGAEVSIWSNKDTWATYQRDVGKLCSVNNVNSGYRVNMYN